MNFNDPFISSLVPLILLFGIFYFLIIRPQQQRMKAHQAMVAGVKRGDTVVTAGGLIGSIVTATVGAIVLLYVVGLVKKT